LNNQNRKILRIILILAGSLILLSAITIFIIYKNFKSPEILATDSIISFTDKGILFGNTEIMVRSDNSYSIRIDSLHFTMSIKGKTYLEGKSDSSIILLPHQVTKIKLPYVYNSKALEEDFKDEDSVQDDFIIKGYATVFGFKRIPVSIPFHKKIALFKKPKLIGDQNYLRIGNDSIIRANLVLKVFNPNKYDIKMDSLTYNLIIGDREYLHGRHIKNIELPAQQTRNINLPITFDFKKYARHFRGIDSALYKFEFEGLLSTPDIHQEHIIMPFEKKIPVVTDFKLDVQHITLNKFNFKEADLTASLNIGNPNATDFKADNLHWTLEVGGSKWAEGVYNKNITLRKKSAVHLELPLHIDIKKLDNSARDYLTGDKIQNYKIEANLNLKTNSPDMKEVKMDIQNSGVLHLKKLLKKK
jgi:LEA14-like dessication related protein